MANIVINEVSQNYTYNIGTSSFATVALPITASWGPGYFDPAVMGISQDEMLENTTWIRYPANQQGLEKFVAAYRGPATNYRLSKDYSYQLAMTLLTAGYDILVCRLCPGKVATGGFSKSTTTTEFVLLSSQPEDWATNYADYFELDAQTSQYVAVSSVTQYDALPAAATKPDDWDETYGDYFVKNDQDEYVPNTEPVWSTAKALGLYTASEVAPEFAQDTYYKEEATTTTTSLTLSAKYPGSFGNNLSATLAKRSYVLSGETKYYWNLIIYVTDSTGVSTALENKTFVFDVANSSDTLLHWSEIESDFVVLDASADCTDSITFDNTVTELAGGTDRQTEDVTDTLSTIITQAKTLAAGRFTFVGEAGSEYLAAFDEIISAGTMDLVSAYNIRYMEWLYNAAVGFSSVGELDPGVYTLLYDKLAYNPNRIIAPGWDDQNLVALGSSAKITEISPLHIALMNCGYYSRCATAYLDVPKSVARSDVYGEEGYVQKLARFLPTAAQDINGTLYSTHSAFFAPWGQYIYVGTSKQNQASPSFLALMIHRAQILNQSLQYEWALPTNRKHNLKLGKMDYNVPKKLLDIWQTLDGVGVNVITDIPDLGTNVWGNSTLYEVPPATYQALANLSTRWLVNAIEDVAYRVGISITFQYNNQESYSAFYAGVSPILDTMRNVGAIDDYKIRMAADIDGLDSVNANSVVGQIYITVNGVINDITIDLVALPPSVDSNAFI